jgi:hypothetical protein
MSEQLSIRAFAWKEQSLAGTYWGVVAKTHLDPSEKHNSTIVMDGDGPAQPKLQLDMPADELKRLAEWVIWRDNMNDASNEDLARALLTKGPHWGPLSDLIEIAAERLSPGIIDLMADEQEAKEKAAASMPPPPVPPVNVKEKL